MVSFIFMQNLSVIISNWLCKQLNWNDKKIIDRVQYGIICMSYNGIKTVILAVLAYLLGVLPHLIIFLVAYSILRFFSFGIHMDSPMSCLVFSTTTILACIGISIYIAIPNIINYALIVFSLIFQWRYSPSFMKNNVKRNYKKKKQLRNLSVISVCLICVIGLVLNNSEYSQLLYFACFLQTLMILPITFKLFRKEVCTS